MRLGVKAALVDGEFVDGDVEVSHGLIDAVGLTPAASGGLALPGFVDVQVNGFAGVDFASAEPGDYADVAPALAATGVTAYQPTFITLPEKAYVDALGAIAAARELTGAPRILGAHLEGPFLSPLRAGAHDPGNMVDPDIDLMDRLIAAGPVSHVTLAPELPGALGMIEHLRSNGVVVACGHSDADAEIAGAAFDEGATAVTHLFNAQRPFGHRDPGIAGAALFRDDVIVTVIVDGTHLADEVVRIVASAAPGRLALITDAIAATGMPDGSYPLGDRQVVVADGVARLEDGTLAGSVLTMDQAVRNLIELEIPAPEAVAAATAVPAGLVGRPELGTLRPGTPGDVVVVDDRFEVRQTLVAGEVVFSAS